MSREYSPEVKAAVMAALMDGQTIRQVSRDTGVSKSTVAAWGKEAAGLLEGVHSVPDNKKDQIRDLLIDLLVAKLQSQIALAEHASNKRWLMLQDASAVAMLSGVNDDKLMRYLEKFEDDGSES